MDNDNSESNSEIEVTDVKSVSAGVLSLFFDELAKVESLSEIAPKLRQVVLVDGVFAEPAVRAAMFPDAP
jgi:hypothetical protein